MSDVQHTKGPWMVSSGCDQYVCTDGKWVASTMGIRGEEGAANARLIAAAPELLAVLKDILDNSYVGKHGQLVVERSKYANYPAWAYHKGKAALAKATRPSLPTLPADASTSPDGDEGAVSGAEGEG